MVKIFFLLLVAGVLVLLAVLAEGRRELRFFKVTDYHLKVPKLQMLDAEKRIVLLADLHNKVYGRDNGELLAAVKKAEPDFILIAGDMLIGKEGTFYKEASDFVSRLPEIAPVYYSLGNHEQRMKVYTEKYGRDTFKEYKKKLVKAGVIFLENETASCMLDRLPVKIHGLELPIETYEKFKKHRVSEESIRKCIGRADKESYHILLAHNPAFCSAYRAWGADLILSGHLHGGIIRCPGIGGIITPQMVFFPKYSGEMTVEDEQAVVVSKGLGTHTVNLRFCNYAELVVVHLEPEK